MPPNPNQVAERADVARWEANYKTKQQQRRQQQQADLACDQQQEPQLVLSRHFAVGGLPAAVHNATDLKHYLQPGKQRQQGQLESESAAEVGQQGAQQQHSSMAAGIHWRWWSSLIGSSAHQNMQH